MKKITFITFIIIITLFVSQMVYAAEENEYNYEYDWLDFVSFNSLQFTDTYLSLPTKDIKDFSAEGHEELMDMATKFGNISIKNKTVEIDGEEKEIQAAEIKPLPGVEVNADYGQQEDKLETEKWTNINLEYELNDSTKIYAGYGLESRESLDFSKPEDNFEKIYNKEKSQKKLLGISYQTSDHLTISAGYIEDSLKTEDSGNSTSLGIKYIDDKGQLKASYQVDKGEEAQGTITGLELALPDIATLSASYKLLNPELIEARLNKESIWDFGLDVNISEGSSLSVGYQLKKNKEDEENQEEENEESKFQASFKVDF